MNRLMIGPGNSWRDGWKRLDADKRFEADFTATIPPLPAAVKALAWQEIEWIHGITSLYLWEAEAILPELLSVLVPGGKLTLEQPDFRHAVQKPEWLFGDPALKNKFHMNHWSYTPETLTAMLRAAGFARVDILPARHHLPARDFRVEAYAR